MKKKKEYFFYKNTKEYFFIRLCLLMSCLIAIALTIIKICNIYICKEWDWISNLLLSLSTGYIISYFYFYLVTLSNYKDSEASALRILRGIYLNIKTIQIKMDKQNEIKDTCIYISSWRITLDDMKIFFINNSDMYLNIILIIHTLSTLVETKDVTKEEILECLERIDDKYQKIFDVFADGNEMKDRIKSELEYLLKQSATRYPA